MLEGEEPTTYLHKCISLFVYSAEGLRSVSQNQGQEI